MFEQINVLLFQKDYENKGRDRYFFGDVDAVVEVPVGKVAEFTGRLICHDYWLIAPAIHSATSKLPQNVVDLDEFRFLVEGKRVDRRARDRRDFLKSIADICPSEAIQKYAEFYAGRGELCIATTMAQISNAALLQWGRLCLQAGFSGELSRCLDIEFPVLNYLTACMCDGIRIDTDCLKTHRTRVDHDYYTELRDFGVDFNLAFEVPSDESAVAYLEGRGYDFSDLPLDYVVDLIPTADGFGDRLARLRKLSIGRAVLWSLSVSRNRVQPIVDLFGSRTSRIYLRDPALQSLAKQHRNIIIPSEGRLLKYVDFGQFEVGIMGALSGDEQLKSLFAKDDMYLEMARMLYDGENPTPEQRGVCKRLFLSYAYGMSTKNLLDAACENSINRQRAKSFFKNFLRFEDWKKEIHHIFLTSNRVGTSEGNFMTRLPGLPLTEKEKRSAVSQVVQGTASLIFKKALIKLQQIPKISIKIPMHDAVLFECDAGYDVGEAIAAMESAMTEHFEGVVVGKARADLFYKPPAV